MERRRARGLVLVDAAGRSRASRRESLGRSSSTERTPAIPETALQRDLDSIPRKRRADPRAIERRRTSVSPTTCSTPIPAATDALVRLMFGALVPGREGGLLNARLRYFDPARRRAGVPEDVAALVSELGDRRTVVTLVNLNATDAAHGDRAGGRLRRASVRIGRVERTDATVGARQLTVQLAPGAGAKLDVRDATLREPANGRVPLG